MGVGLDPKATHTDASSLVTLQPGAFDRANKQNKQEQVAPVAQSRQADWIALDRQGLQQPMRERMHMTETMSDRGNWKTLN